jgi:hypothetical protein
MGNKPQLPSASVCNTASSREKGERNEGEFGEKNIMFMSTQGKKRKLPTTPRKTRGNKDIRDCEIVR